MFFLQGLSVLEQERRRLLVHDKNMHILSLHERTKHMQAATTFSTERIFEV